MQVIQFRAHQIRRENRDMHLELATKTDAELDAEYLRLVTLDAWEQFQMATRAMRVAQAEMDAAHKRWFALSRQGADT